jgi:hypothetical protein
VADAEMNNIERKGKILVLLSRALPRAARTWEIAIMHLNENRDR